MMSANPLENRRPLRDEAVLKYLAGESGSLYYEIQVMLLAAARKALNTPPGVEHNMAVESFLVHYRNFRDFLYPPPEAWTNKRYFDDVIAFDYSPEWNVVQDDWSGSTPNEKDRIDKLLAHLSYSRPQLEHAWPIPEMLRKIKGSFGEFILGLSPVRREWFRVYGDPK